MLWTYFEKCFAQINAKKEEMELSVHSNIVFELWLISARAFSAKYFKLANGYTTIAILTWEIDATVSELVNSSSWHTYIHHNIQTKRIRNFRLYHDKCAIQNITSMQLNILHTPVNSHPANLILLLLVVDDLLWWVSGNIFSAFVCAWSFILTMF